jgi:LPXTG-motif cell wall-anchored protein
MYAKTATIGSAGAASGGLAMTGQNSLWVLLAGFAMLGAGMALMRIVPRRGA